MNRVLALVAGVFLAMAGLGSPPAMAQTAPEVRVQMMIGALSSGDPAVYEAAAQANLSAAALARREPAQRAEMAQRIYTDFGQLRITRETADGASLRVDIAGQNGATAVFSFTFDATPEQKIDSLRIEAGEH